MIFERINLFFVFVILLNFTFCYKIPNVKLELLEDYFQVSIPDSHGIKFVAFNININRQFQSFEPGEISVQIKEPSNNLWIYKLRKNLDVNDILNIWTMVQLDNVIYQSLPQTIPVKSIKNSNLKNQNENEKCAFSITIVNGQTTCKDKLIFQDVFETEIDQNKWQQEVRFPNDNGDAEFVLYEKTSHVSNGVLTIPLILWDDFYKGSPNTENFVNLGERCTGNTVNECQRNNEGLSKFPPIVSGRINTKNSFTFKYGRVEIKAKLPIGDWIVPLLMLESSKNQYGLDPYVYGQLRVAFIRSNPFLLNRDGIPIDGSNLFGGAILSKHAQDREQYMVKISNKEHWGNDYHIFSMEWDKKNIILRVDGIMYGKIENNFFEIDQRNYSNGENVKPFTQEYFVTLGLAVGGHGDFPDGAQSENYFKPWNNTSPKAASMFRKKMNNWRCTWSSNSLKVDYIKIFAI